MFCKECGASIDDNRQYCPICNWKVIKEKPTSSPNMQPQAIQSPTEKKVVKSNPEATASFVLGIICLVVFPFPVLAVIASAVGVILGIRSILKRKDFDPSVKPTLGLVFSSIALLLSVYFTIYFIINFVNASVGV